MPYVPSMSAAILLVYVLSAYGIQDSSAQVAAPPATARTLFSAAFKLFQSGDFEGAAPLFERGLVTAPRDSKAHYYYAQCLERLGRTDDAMHHYALAIKLEPNGEEGLLAAAGQHRLRAAEAARQAQRAEEVQRRAEVKAGEETRRVAEAAADEILQGAAGLKWTKSDNGSDINWSYARSWCAQKGGGWRLPTVEELEGLYNASDAVKTRCAGNDICKAPPGFELTGTQFWSGESDGSSYARIFDDVMGPGCCISARVVSSKDFRALCVRRS